MDLNHIVTFLRVVEAGSFTAAARGLGVPTSTVSRQVAQLEETLGVRLLQRTSRHVQLTEAGLVYRDQMTPALTMIEEATSEVRDQHLSPCGLVRLTAPTDLSVEMLAEPLVQFAQLYPRIQVELVLTGRTVDLVAEGIDLALRAGVVRDVSLIARKVSPAQLALIASEGYLARRGEPTSLADLVNHDCIGFRSQRGRVTWTLEGPSGPESVEVNCRLSADDYAFVRALALAGAGVTLAPLPIAPHSELRLRRILPAYAYHAPGLHLVYPSAKHLPRRVVLLRDFLLQYLASAQAARPAPRGK